jgi:hypothetical protein
MTGFGDLNSAARMRDTIKRISRAVVNEMRPEDRIGRVYSIDPVRQMIRVQFPGDQAGESIQARCAVNMIPTKSFLTDGIEGADLVRVSGKPGNYWVSDFVRGSPVGVDVTVSSPARWGSTTAWLFAGQLNIPVAFADGLPPREGDMVVSSNTFGTGDAAAIVNVISATHADVQYLYNIRGPQGATGATGSWTTDDTGWQVIGAVGQPALVSPWANYGSPWQDARFSRLNGVVHLDGLIRSTTGAVGNIFTLPAGYRPSGQSLYSANGNPTYTTGAASTGTAHTHTGSLASQTARISIDTNGVVSVSGTPLAANSHLSFAGISFRAA